MTAVEKRRKEREEERNGVGGERKYTGLGKCVVPDSDKTTTRNYSMSFPWPRSQM